MVVQEVEHAGCMGFYGIYPLVNDDIKLMGKVHYVSNGQNDYYFDWDMFNSYVTNDQRVHMFSMVNDYDSLCLLELMMIYEFIKTYGFDYSIQP